MTFEKQTVRKVYKLRTRIAKGHVLIVSGWTLDQEISVGALAESLCCVLEVCMIRLIYLQSIAPLTIYLGRSFPRHERCLGIVCSFFAVFSQI